MSDGPKPNSRRQVPFVVNSLGRQIVSGKYQPGSTLPVEPELAALLSVSRNTLREAVKVLAGKGLISTAPRSGTKVRLCEDWNMLDQNVLEWHADPKIATRQFMLDILEMRRIIEPKAAELAAHRGQRKDIAHILDMFEQMESAQANSNERMIADIAFHSAVLGATHNMVLASFKHAIITYLKAHFEPSEDPQTSAQDLERHRKIAWAIAGGKAKTAHNMTVQLLDANQKIIEKKAS